MTQVNFKNKNVRNIFDILKTKMEDKTLCYCSKISTCLYHKNIAEFMNSIMLHGIEDWQIKIAETVDYSMSEIMCQSCIKVRNKGFIVINNDTYRIYNTNYWNVEKPLPSSCKKSFSTIEELLTYLESEHI